MSMRRSRRHARRRTPDRRASRRPRLEQLEHRLLLAIDIEWTNRGDTGPLGDQFESVFTPAQAAAARQVVDAALEAWEDVIVSMNDSENPDDLVEVFIAIDTGETACGASATSDGHLGSHKPVGGTIWLDGCNTGWFVDPTPEEHSEFLGSLQNPFLGASLGVNNDLYSVVVHEMTHVLGLSTSGFLIWGDMAANSDPRMINTGFSDQVNGGVGTLWVYNAGPIQALFTSNNGGNSADASDKGMPVHASPPPNTALNYGGFDYYSVQSHFTPTGPGGRTLPSALMARVMANAYGYTIVPADTLPNFHSHLDANGNLLVRGASASGDVYNQQIGDSSDVLTLTVNNGKLEVDVDLGVQVPGTDIAWSLKSEYNLNDINTITVQGYGHNNLGPADGHDTIVLDLGDQLWLPAGGITVDGGTGQNTLVLHGPQGANNSYTVTGQNINLSGLFANIGYTNVAQVDVIAHPNSTDNTMVIDQQGTSSAPLKVTLIGGNHHDTMTVASADTQLTKILMEGLAGDDILSVEQKSVSTLVEMRGGDHNDLFHISPTAQDLDTTPGFLVALGEGGTDGLMLNDLLHPAAAGGIGEQYKFSITQAQLGQFDRNSDHQTTFDATMEQIVLEGSQGNDVVQIFETFANTDLTVNTHLGDDLIHVDSNGIFGNGGVVDGIRSQLALDGGGGTLFGADLLVLNDAGDSDSNTVLVTESNVIGSNTFFGLGGSVMYSGFSQMEIALGRSGDQVTVQSTAKGTDTDIFGGLGKDSFAVAGPPDAGQGGSNSKKDRRAFTVDGVKSTLTIDGQLDSDKLTVVDVADTTGDTVTVTQSTIGMEPGDNFFGPLGGLVYLSIADLKLLEGKGHDTTRVYATHADTDTLVNTGKGDDQVLIHNPALTVNDIQGPLSVDGNSGTDLVTVDDSTEIQSTTATLTDQKLGGGGGDNLFGGGTLAYQKIEGLDVRSGVGDDHWFVRSTSSQTPTQLLLGDGIDLVTVTKGGSVDGITSPLTIDGEGGSNNVVALLDSFDGTADQVTFTAQEVGAGAGDTFFGSGGRLVYANLSQLNAVTGMGNDTLQVLSSPSTTKLLLGAGGGDDVIHVDSNGSLPGGSVEKIHGPLEIFGGTGNNGLIINDADNGGSTNVTLRATGATSGEVGQGAQDTFFAASGKIDFDQMQVVGLRTGQAADRVSVKPSLVSLYTLFGSKPTFAAPPNRDNLTFDLAGVSDPNVFVVDQASGQLQSSSHAMIAWQGFEILGESSGVPFPITMDLNAGALPGNDSVADVVELRRGFNGSPTFEVSLNGNPMLTSVEAATHSFHLEGSTDGDTMLVTETSHGLPRLAGDLSPPALPGHTNSAFQASGRTPQNVSINMDGGPGNAIDRFDLQLISAHDVAKYDDVVATANSGVVNVLGEFTASYESLSPVDIQGSGGTILVDASLVRDMTMMKVVSLGGNRFEVVGDGRFEYTTFNNFDTHDIVPPGPIQPRFGVTVNSTADEGDTDPGDGRCRTSDRGDTCTLRAALEEANAGRVNLIEFDIRGEGPHSIQPLGPLPPVTDTVVIDGFSQPGSSPNTNRTGGVNTSWMIEVSGARLSENASGLVVTARDSTLRGLAVNGFGRADARGVPGGGIQLLGGGNRIEGMAIGTDTTGTSARPNEGFGVYVASAGNRIGGSSPDERNVVSGNRGSAVWLTGPNASDNIVSGNLVGTQGDGSRPLSNGGDGVRVDAAGANTIGGTRPGDGNVIAYNRTGVVVRPGSETTAEGNTILGNAIYENRLLGIDLVASPEADADGPTANDTDDADRGPNGLQNYPSLFSAAPGSRTRVAGSLQSRPQTPFLLEFFVSPQADPSGYGEGHRPAGTARVVTDARGRAAFELRLPAGSTEGEWLTATATDRGGSTSEFSRALRIGMRGVGGDGSGGEGEQVVGPGPGSSDTPVQPPIESMDVNGDGIVSPLDVLPVINYLNQAPNEQAIPAGHADAALTAMDVNADGILSAIDALMIINHLNHQSVEGEAFLLDAPANRHAARRGDDPPDGTAATADRRDGGQWPAGPTTGLDQQPRGTDDHRSLSTASADDHEWLEVDPE